LEGFVREKSLAKKAHNMPRARCFKIMCNALYGLTKDKNWRTTYSGLDGQKLSFADARITEITTAYTRHTLR